MNYADWGHFCRIGAIKQIQQLLSEGETLPPVPEDDYYGGGLLGRAAYFGHPDLVKLLLDLGADVHAFNDYAIRHSAVNGHLEVVQILLDAGADVHAKNDEIIRRIKKQQQLQRWSPFKDRREEMLQYLKRYVLLTEEEY